MILFLGSFLILCCSPADAHGLADSLTSASAWTADPLIVLPLYSLAILYLIGANRLWANAGFGRGTTALQLAYFWIGWTTLTLALLSPLHALSEQFLSAHMVEHELIMVVAAPLLVLSRPLGTLLWALPEAWRRPMALQISSPFGWAWRCLTIPALATALHSFIIWAWHFPALFNAALANPWLHMLQHVCFLLVAVIFWWAILNVPRTQLSVSALHLFITMIAMTALGALIALSPHLLYGTYQGNSEAYWRSDLDDQQLAGVIMWVPGCAIYALAALALLGKWILASATPHGPSMRSTAVNVHLSARVWAIGNLTILAGLLLSSLSAYGQAKPSPDMAQSGQQRCLSREDLLALKDSRSVIAEAALGTQLFADSRSTSTFTNTLLDEARDELQSARSSLADLARASHLIDSALTDISAQNAASLRDISAQLLAMEHANEQCS
jgi:putative membrane protein